MRYHDYHLAGYSVLDFGGTIILDLVYNYPGQPIRESQIEFTGVSLYHFVHTGAAIITDISPTPIATILSDHASEISERARRIGLEGWPDNMPGYEKNLQDSGVLGWSIESALGLYGFVIGKKVKQKSETVQPS
jgi:hypothetical protein